jgi:hypothetical protein
MLKSIDVEYRGRKLTLECTHARQFPPPQMYGHTPDDIDTMWRQGTIDQNLYQLLTTWREHCGIMVMGPKCLDCPLALKQNPRPGRPHVIETEPWLTVKDQIHWEDMARNKTLTSEDTEVIEDPAEIPEPRGRAPEPVSADLERVVLGDVERPHVPAPSAGSRPPSIADQIAAAGDTPESTEPPEKDDAAVEDDIIDALADD